MFVSHAMAVFGVVILSLDGSVSQYANCSGYSSWLGDGFCDVDTNNEGCGYDGGDCCACTCVDTTYACGFNGLNCSDPACPDEDPSPDADCTVTSVWLSDGFCDADANNPACRYDGGDCCACSCVDGPLYSCGWNDFDCKDVYCLDLAVATDYVDCAGNWLTIGDGLCTEENNNAACGYDGGDCCLCTCDSSACRINEFNCTDPSAGDEFYDCNPSLPPATSAPCPADGRRAWVVEDTTHARALAEAVNCSGGLFEVLWKGDVVLDTTIYIVDGTVFNVTGSGLLASMDGNSTTRLLTVVNASVHVTGVNMSYGAATVGGAIGMVRSNLTLDGTTFVGNTATGHGGAIYATDNSVVSFVGDLNMFDGNTAGIDGGAVFISDSTCSGGGMTFLNNTAGDEGGALMITERSTLSWSGSAIYRGNKAGGAGGAISSQHRSTTVWSTAARFEFNSAEGSSGAVALETGSNASWYGESTFKNNRARHHGGALHVRDDSHVSWNVTTVFIGNRAGLSGGAIRLTYSSSAIWVGITRYVENSGAFGGGAIMISIGSYIISSGNTTFFANKADEISGGAGGAVFVSDYSVATLDGGTSLSKNSAAHGGAVYVGLTSGLYFGDTAFSRNSAGDGGAVYVGDNSNLYFGGKAVFSGNAAVGEELPGRRRSGGALAVQNSTITLIGETIFTGNRALLAGGAVSTFESTVLWTGRSWFVNNSGGSLGGAVIYMTSNVVVEGNTTFHGNTAESGGGVHMYESTVKWGGVTEFENNSAYLGGALAAYGQSNVSWSDQLTLLNNRAFGNGTGAGGGFAVFDGARVSWSGPAIFTNNSAHLFGGALHLSADAAVSWSGDTVFFGCTSSFGGALFIVTESAVGWTGRTKFTSNKATISGGAVASYESDGGANGRESTISINGSTIFANNTAGATGGGFFVSNGKVSATFISPDVLFIGNSAGVAGGAVSVSGFGNGPNFFAVRFVSNSAGAGGAAFITGSGNDQIDTAAITSAYATKFDRCQFVDNRATATGGAIESVAGQDYISNTVFVGNTARVGGALRLAGKAGLDNCSFVDNTSDEGEGAAVHNIGVITVMKDSSFIGNFFNCQPGTYVDFNVSDNVFEVACDGCGASCPGCTFEESPLVVPICTETMEHSTSSGGSTTLATVSIDRGFWRATSNSTDVLACYRDEACLGGVTGSIDYCRNGYEGPYCSICSDGYAASFGFACGKCSEKAGGIVLVIVLLVVVLLGAAAVASYATSSKGLDSGGGGRGTIERLTRFIPLPSIKIVIVALQIVTQFTAIANVTYPHVYQRFLDTVNVINLDVGWISQLSVGCLFDIGTHGRLLIATIGPITAAMFLGLTYIVATRGRGRGVLQFGEPISRNGRESAETLRIVRHRHVSMMLLLTFLVYSSVSSVLFQMFACDDLADGKRYLRADYRVQCGSSKHGAFQVYAGFMIVLYTVGIPTFYTVLLVRNRGVLKDGVGREASQGTQAFSDLWKPYKPSVFYYEVIECGRRVLLTGAVVFIYPNTSAQVAVTLIIAFVFAITSEGFAPFASRWDTWISRMGHVVVYVSMYVALLLKVDVSNEQSSSQKVFEGVLVTAHVGMVLAVVAETVVLLFSLRGTVRESISPKTRGTVFPTGGSVETMSEM